MRVYKGHGADPAVTDARHDERVGAALRALLESDPGCSVQIHGWAENDGFPPGVSVTVLAGGGRLSANREGLLSALQDVTGHVEAKRCLKCGELKRLRTFSRDRTCEDGYARRCKECESARRREFRRRKKAPVDAAPAPA